MVQSFLKTSSASGLPLLFHYPTFSRCSPTDAGSAFIAEVPQALHKNKSFQALKEGLFSPQGAVLGAGILLLVFLSMRGTGRKKGKLAKGKLGGIKEKRNAKKIALKQMSERKRQPAAVYVGRPSKTGRQPLYIPDAQRGIAVVGGPGSGKTVSVIDQVALSIFDQGFPAIIWDFKYPEQTSRIIPYAAMQGYDVRVFAPGYPESAVINPLMFLENESDSLMARQLSEVIVTNFARLGDRKEDGFFGPSGKQVMEAIFMLARGSKHSDIILCQALASRTNLAHQIIKHKDKLNPWVLAAFGQLISAADSEKTVAGILATANINFSTFIKNDILPAFVGNTSIPLRLEGKQVLVIGLDRQKRDVISPLVASILHMIVNKNLGRDEQGNTRKTPLFLLADEVPTLYLPSLANWLNEAREDGLCTLLGFQNMAQLEKMYGKELSRTILGGCGTRFIFNPQDKISAKDVSESLGEREVRFRQRSTGHSGGKRNVSRNEQVQTRPLVSVDEILGFPAGKCIAINPHFASGARGYVPLIQKIHLSEEYKEITDWGKEKWPKMRSKLAAQSPQKKIGDDDILSRYAAAEKMFPSSKKEKEDEAARKEQFRGLLSQ